MSLIKGRFFRWSIRVRATKKVDEYLTSDVSCGEIAHLLEGMSKLTDKHIDKAKSPRAKALLNQVTDELRLTNLKIEQVSLMERGKAK